MKIAVVSGASSGIGYALAALLLANDFKVYGISRRSSEIKHPNFIWIRADLTKAEEINKIASRIEEDDIDVLINNAGIAFESEGLKFTQEEYESVFNINFIAPILLTKCLKSKLNNKIVINISSVSDRLVGEQYALYCSSKAALNKYFEVLALEEKRINFISILPTFVDTPLLRKLQEDRDFDWEATVKATEVAEFVQMLIYSNDKVSSGAKIIVVTNSLEEDLDYNEDLWGFNVDTKELFKLDQ